MKKHLLSLFALLIYYSFSFAQSPTLTINGPKHISIEVYSTFTLPEATAMDNEDGDISDSIELTINIDTSTLSSGHVIYSVIDSDGNEAKDTLFVSTIDSEMPTLSGRYGDTITFQISPPKNPLDFIKFSDNYDDSEDLRNNYQLISTNLTTSGLDSYYFIIRTEDNSGNQSEDFTLIIEKTSQLNIQNKIKPEINIYPNPTSGIITIEAQDDVTLVVSDINGKKISISPKSNANKSTLDFTSFPRGFYFVNIIGKDFNVIEKIQIW